MAVSYSPFESKSGFSSPGFLVNSTGVLTTQTITTNSINATTIDTANITINGNSISQPSTLPNLEITGDFIISEGSTHYISVVNGQIILTNRSDSTGSINNIDIGNLTPRSGYFTNLSATTSLTLNVSSTGTINNVNIGATTAGTGRFTAITLTQEAVTDSQVPTKRYVDTRIPALAIALGS